MITPLLITAIVLYFTFLAWKRYQHYQLREKLGLPGPPAGYLRGNFPEMLRQADIAGYDNSYETAANWFKEYGSTYGFYAGHYLQIMTIDPEFIKEVFVKQFSKFTDRCNVGIMEMDGLHRSLLQVSKENNWKNIRSCMSPQFSTGNMKLMHATVKGKIDEFLDIMKERADAKSTFNIYDDLQALTLDVIGRCAFAVECNCQRNRDEVFYVMARTMVRQTDLKLNPLFLFSMILPEFDSIYKLFYSNSGLAAAERPLLDGLQKVYDERIQSGDTGSVDILQLLLNKENLNSANALTKEEVIHNCIGFLLAGYETTSTALGYACYHLARNPEVQEKLFEEVKRTSETSGINYDSVHAMKYLDCVFKETLRIAPPVIFFTARECLEDTEVCGITIPKGAWVSMQPYAIHHSEETWPNPKLFQPERFVDWDDKNSLTWVPFGVGPRNCIGMRFAEMEFKMVLAKLIEKFRLSVKADAEKLKCDTVSIIMIPKENKIMMDIEARA